MSSRVSVLRKELGDVARYNGTSADKDIRDMLPTSDYLRGAGYSDFVHLYDWLRATDRNQPGKLTLPRASARPKGTATIIIGRRSTKSMRAGKATCRWRSSRTRSATGT